MSRAPRPRLTRRRVAIGAVVVVLVLLAGGQLVLPWIAAKVVRDDLGDPDADVTVKAFPAWKMALGKVDSIDLRAGTVKRSDNQLADLLERAKEVGRIDATIAAMDVGDFHLRDVRTHLEDGRVTASAQVTLADLQQMAPGGATLTALPAGADGTPRFQVAVSVFGSQQQIPVVVRATEGKIEVAPDNALGAVFRLTVFENPRLWIDGVRSSAAGQSVRMDVTGRLR
ncbi:LmeA family phospholipid-binding protein [Patulibacter defluvii]|uniref:LmeA family phospholipid-binding protein n=1 Tax=Patulibacter defluvii TaxID=3095358 RepID=UPI002A757982|nr:LmeA family phospholipid-binding protein [Patulibacter sp. DM4]